MNRHTGAGFWTFTRHRYVAIAGRHMVCLYCGEPPNEVPDENHCPERAQAERVHAIRAARDERGLGG